MADLIDIPRKRIVRLPGHVLKEAGFLHQFRTSVRINQKDIADIADISQGTVSNAENGTGKPLFETVVKMVWAMGGDLLLEVPEDVLLFIDEVKED